MRHLLSKQPSAPGAVGHDLPVDTSGHRVLVGQPSAAFSVSFTSEINHAESPDKKSEFNVKSAQMIYNEHFSGLEVIYLLMLLSDPGFFFIVLF